MSPQSEDDIELYRNITSTSTIPCICCLYYIDSAILGITFILFAFNGVSETQFLVQWSPPVDGVNQGNL